MVNYEAIAKQTKVMRNAQVLMTCAGVEENYIELQ